MLHYTGCSEGVKELSFDEYEQFNMKFKRRLIWHFGTGNGFYSELNGLLLGVLYAAQYQYQFVLYAQDKNLCMPNGWEDVFLPFCPRFSFSLIGRSILIGTNHNCRRNKLTSLYKMFSEDITEDDVFWYTHTNRFAVAEYNIPELGIKGDIHQAMRRLIPLVYRFNPFYRNKIDELKATIKLPDQYVGIHIRVGDKANEVEIIPPHRYLDKMKCYTSEINTFIYTDNIHVVNELRRCDKDLFLYSFVDDKDQGFDMKTVTNMSDEDRQLQLIKMFASIEVLLCSVLFVGTYSSNPGMFIGMLLDKKHIIGMDYPEWLLL